MFLPSYMQKLTSYTKPVKLYSTLTIVYEVLHSYTTGNLKFRILKFIYGFWTGEMVTKREIFSHVKQETIFGLYVPYM